MVHLSQVYISEPMPASYAAALQPCPAPTPALTLNQYVMDGVNVREVRSTITSVGGNQYTLENLRQNASWQWRRPDILPGVPSSAPVMAPLPTVGNALEVYYGNRIYPQYEDPVSLLVPPPRGHGFGFWQLPIYNEHFGVYEVKHFVGSTHIGTSPVAMFYTATGAAHPPDPPGQLGNLPTMNFFYYYSHALACNK